MDLRAWKETEVKPSNFHAATLEEFLMGSSPTIVIVKLNISYENGYEKSYENGKNNQDFYFDWLISQDNAIKVLIIPLKFLNHIFYVLFL